MADYPEHNFYHLPPLDDSVTYLNDEWFQELQRASNGEIQPEDFHTMVRLENHPTNNFSRWCTASTFPHLTIPKHGSAMVGTDNHDDDDAMDTDEDPMPGHLDPTDLLADPFADLFPTEDDNSDALLDSPLHNLPSDGQNSFWYSTHRPLDAYTGFITQDQLDIVRADLDPIDFGHDDMLSIVRLMDDENGNARWCTARAYPVVKFTIAMHPARWAFERTRQQLDQILLPAANAAPVPVAAPNPRPTPPAPFAGPVPAPAPPQGRRIGGKLRWDNQMRYVINVLWGQNQSSRPDRVRIFNHIFQTDASEGTLSSQASMRKSSGNRGISQAWRDVLTVATDPAEIAMRAAMDVAITTAKQNLGIP